MKRFNLALLVIVTLFSVLCVPILSAGSRPQEPNALLTRGALSAKAVLFGCRVSTQGGSLNVRNNAGYVIAKLPNGTSLRIVSDRGSKFLIAAYEGRRTVRGWVSSEFVTCN